MTDRRHIRTEVAPGRFHYRPAPDPAWQDHEVVPSSEREDCSCERGVHKLRREEMIETCCACSGIGEVYRRRPWDVSLPPLTIEAEADEDGNHILRGTALNGNPLTIRIPCHDACPVCAVVSFARPSSDAPQPDANCRST